MGNATGKADATSTDTRSCSSGSNSSDSNSVSEMAWVDRNHNDSPFHDSFDCDSHGVAQLLVLVFRAYFSPVIFLHGFAANVFALVAFSRLQKRAPGRFNLYAIAITVSFLFLLVFDTLLDDFIGRGLGWLSQCCLNLKMDQISSLSCKMITYLTDTSGFIATTTLAIFGLDRVRTVCSPLQFTANRHLRSTVIAILGVVLLALALFSPTFLFYDIVVSNVTNKSACTLTNPSLPGATYILLMYVIGSYTLPTVVIIVCNLLIAYHLVVLKHRHRKCGIDSTHRHDTRRIIGHLAINTIFLLLMIPLVVVILMRYESSLRPWRYSEEYRQRLVHLSRFFSSLLSIYFSSSFWVFFLFLPSFRDAVLEMLLACPLIAGSVCGRYLYSRMTYGGARRFRAKSMTASMMLLAPLAPQAIDGVQASTRGSLPPSNVAILLATRPQRSSSSPNIVETRN